MYLTWLDSNSWLIEMGGQRILLDPWLVGPLVFGNLPWLFKGERPKPMEIPSSIDLILLSQGLEDHAHPATLQQLDHTIPVVASVNAAKVVQQLGYQQVTPLSHGQTIQVSPELEITAVPGSPIGPMLVENGYVLKELKTNQTLYYEPHGYHSPQLKQWGKIDVIITPMVDLTIPLLGPIIQGHETALQIAQWLQPQIMLPTADGKEIQFSGVLTALLRAKGSLGELRANLESHHLGTQVLEPLPGKRLELLKVAEMP